MFDAHCHIHMSTAKDAIGETIQKAKASGVEKISLCSTGVHDWDTVANLARSYPYFIVPNFGVHPWWAAEVSDGWLERLEIMLKEFPNAGVGEVGLCQAAKGKKVPKHLQERVCLEQIRLAQKLQRPLSIHCVYRHGRMLELLSEGGIPTTKNDPLRFMIHAYSGGPEMIDAYVKLGGYLSFGGGITNERSEKMRDSLRKCPQDRLLVETDSPDMAPSVESLLKSSDTYCQVIAAKGQITENEPAFLAAIIQQVAELRTSTTTEIITLTSQNAHSFFKLNAQ